MRRKFHEALSNDKDRASHVLSEMQKLYAIERHLTDNEITGESKIEYRKQHAMPILKEKELFPQNWAAKVTI